MTDQYLPEIYSRFREQFPALSANLEALAESANAGPLDERTSRLVKLGIAIGAMSEGAVRSNARRALQAARNTRGGSPRRCPDSHHARLPGGRGVLCVDRGRSRRERPAGERQLTAQGRAPGTSRSI